MEKKKIQQNSAEPVEKDILPLHIKEIDLILKMREKYRFGEITIKVRDGRPWSIEKTTITEVLGIF